MEGKPIDIIIPWVDSNDMEWRKSKNFYAGLECRKDLIDDSDVRYRDWDIIRYLFRGIDMYMPWVRTVHFVTVGHLPSWINTEAERLHVVCHNEYIPNKYLPTFSAIPIELNMHRIPGLADQFIFFNDDIIVLKPVKPTNFFKKGLPTDYAILNPLISSHRYAVSDIAIMDIEIINDHFKKNDVIKKNPLKWFNLRYGTDLFRSLCLMPWPKFSTLFTKHQCNAFLKETFEELWNKEYDILDTTCRHKFRSKRDVNQWLMRYWRLAQGKFEPVKPYGLLYSIRNNNGELFAAIMNSKDKFICINDSGVEELVDFDRTKTELIEVLERRFPKKSKFEK